MLIDWFTVFAQALNFLILVWLMGRFLYRPILAAIDSREKKIAAELADADAKRTEAKKERDEYLRKNDEFGQQRAALLTAAVDEVKAERHRLLDAARDAADALSAKRQDSLRQDAETLNQVLVRRAQDEVFAIARKALADLATASLEKCMSEVFIRRIRDMDTQAKATLSAALQTSHATAVVRSAFDLPTEERAKLQNAINETFSADIILHFETAPDLIGGIELTANGRRVGWSIGDYLTSLGKGVDELLKNQKKIEPKSDPKPALAPKPEREANAESRTQTAPELTGFAISEGKPKATAALVAS